MEVTMQTDHEILKHVQDEFEKNAARNAVENIEGVLGVTNNIKVTPTAVPGDIKQKIKSAFLRSATFDLYRINVSVDGNNMRLSGKGRSWAEKKESERQAWLAPGVTRVENDIEIDTEVNAFLMLTPFC